MSFPVIFCVLLAVTGTLTLALHYPPEKDGEKALYDLFDRYGSSKESFVQELQYNNVKERLTWRDCGFRGTVVRFKFFDISPLPLRLPGNITVAINATVESDVVPPISMELLVRKKTEQSWINFCDQVPGGCRRENICSTQPKRTSAEAAAAAEGDDETSQNPLCQMKKGNFTLAPTAFAVPIKVPSGLYRVTAKFHKESKRVACISAELNIG